jgi:hypothetical protein
MRVQVLLACVVAVSAVTADAHQAGSSATAQSGLQAAGALTLTGTPQSSYGPTPSFSEIVTLVGCLARGATTFDPFTLTNPTQVPGMAGNTSESSGVNSRTSATSVSLSGKPVPPYSGSPSTPYDSPGATGGTASAAGGTTTTTGDSTATAGGAGTATAPSDAAQTSTPPAASATTGTMASPAARPESRPGDAAAGSPTGSMRVKGTGLGVYAGQRVQVVGILVPATRTPSDPSIPEFRVSSIVPLAGTCP